MVYCLQASHSPMKRIIQLPSTKILILLAIAIITLAALGYFVYGGGKSGSSSDSLAASAAAGSGQSADQALLATDPSAADRQNALSGKNFLDSTQGGSLDEAPTPAADAFSQELLTKYAQALQSGAPIDDASKQQLVDQMAQSQAFSVDYQQYTSADFPVFSVGSSVKIKEYGNRLGQAIAGNSPKKGQNALVILQTALENQDSSALADLDPIITQYKAMIRQILLVPTPKSAASLEENLLNEISLLEKTLEGMRNVFQNPMNSLSSISKYEQTLSAVNGTAQDFQDYFIGKSVSFSAGEYGYVFTQGK